MPAIKPIAKSLGFVFPVIQTAKQPATALLAHDAAAALN
jgi:hypothetical protein